MVEFKRPSEELMRELQRYDTPGFSDAFDEIGFHGVITGIRPLKPGSKLVGVALTAKTRDLRPVAKTTELSSVVSQCHSGDVLMLDAGGAQVGTWGGLMTLIAQHYKLGGVVIDGCTRDASEIVEANFPCWSTGVVPLSVVSRLRTVSVMEPVALRGVTVRPGDIVIADDDGAIVCPQDLLEEVLPRVRAHYEWEQQTKDELRRGIFDSIKKRVT